MNSEGRTMIKPLTAAITFERPGHAKQPNKQKEKDGDQRQNRSQREKTGEMRDEQQVNHGG